MLWMTRRNTAGISLLLMTLVYYSIDSAGEQAENEIHNYFTDHSGEKALDKGGCGSGQ